MEGGVPLGKGEGLQGGREVREGTIPVREREGYRRDQGYSERSTGRKGRGIVGEKEGVREWEEDKKGEIDRQGKRE